MRDYFIFAITSLKHRKLRSVLTILGIVIGIAAIISLISVSQGLEHAITEQFESMGANLIIIYPGQLTLGGAGMALGDNDLDTVKSMAEYEFIDAYLMGTAEIEYGNEKEFSQYIRGYESEDMQKSWDSFGIELEDGRYWRSGEKYVAVIGYKVANDLFGKKIMVGNRITIKETQFTVIGIVEQLGTEDDDNSVLIPMEIAREIYDKPKEVGMIMAAVKPGRNIDVVAKKTERKLERVRGDEDFNVVTPDQMLEQMGSILNILNVVLVGIAAISLLVGAVGIMNSMFTNVLERKREIGIMKAIGASPKNIMNIFVTEAGVVGALGGTIGVIIGTLIAIAVEQLAQQYGFKFIDIQINPLLIIFGIGFAFIIGSLAGYFPAKKAAKLMPVEALRG